MDADKVSQVLRRLQILEQPATEHLDARRGAEHALVEAQNQTAQLDHALQQGGRPATSGNQVVDTGAEVSTETLSNESMTPRRKS